jgi:hypothetical protein
MDSTAEYTVQEIDYVALQALMSRVEHAIEHGLALDAEDMRLLLAAMHTLLELQSQLEDKDVTLQRLRKLLGMVKSSEQRNGVSQENPGDAQRHKNANKKARKERKPRKKIEPSEVIHHKLEDLSKGDPCPECPNGRLVKQEPKVVLRVSGTQPYEAIKHVIERLKCNLCDYVASAKLPVEVIADGGEDQQYGFSARSMMAILKHFSGVPYFHQETLNDLFGCPITASTIYDQCEWVANDCMPIYHHLRREAANAVLFYIDDTSNRILEQKGEERPNRNGKGTRFRKGIYTSGLIAITRSGHKIYLYQTSLGHAGELLDEILRNRDPSLPAPIIMSDALTSNLPTVSMDVVSALCNAHARRHFVDIVDDYPNDLNPLLDLYGKIWAFDKECKHNDFDGQQRLVHHQEKSLPVMAEIKERCEVLLSAPDAEQHSNLAKACRYVIKHFEGLTQFCKSAGTPIDNNAIEEGLKTPIRTRKSSHFYKTQVGADVANVLMSVIATAYRNDGNPFEYLNEVQRNSAAIKADPAAWVPWRTLPNTT